MRVLHETEQRLLLGRGGQQAEHGESDQERSGTSPGARPKATSQRVLLGLRERVELVEQRRAELMDCRRTASSISASTPVTCATRNPEACSATYRSSAVFPMPASPRMTSTAL